MILRNIREQTQGLFLHKMTKCFSTNNNSKMPNNNKRKYELNKVTHESVGDIPAQSWE